MTYKGVTVAAALALAPLGLALSACSAGTSSTEQTRQKTAETVAVTIITAQGQHKFQVERARTAAEQEQGLMYRTDLKPDGGMLFAPYPPEGGGPREANFWMKNTPTSLDILFLRTDGTIARIAENTTPFSQTPIPSREPVAAVLELVGGRSAELGISEGDSVRWAK
ncbi:DUF192 domain-containing protein [Sphingomonas sanguinis]|jgi:uncharacterized membrane protein (UPF0127 family)|uniref:DUF192 domain-containing protein n=1 Tax=Sphingomonas sanguinis TaxID=33051 RepID=A0A7Y7QSY5_9SPHN|nr:DUF192 domain-containing protein [Sphingomonas sanguinis]MBZ6380599.1 DUF192 domain-containing protein [Sphingomonas sanguinis]NNG49590.1 DUF192 domain-containing protein [Sphingomonas sanguinis]NNG53232.1 DUF192 domain-containing protein [Sphingomonas sanguinis]NVP29901.1 DUF192 domain-containing protein [Sphingomonas sanguinis]